MGRPEEGTEQVDPGYGGCEGRKERGARPAERATAAAPSPPGARCELS